MSWRHAALALSVVTAVTLGVVLATTPAPPPAEAEASTEPDRGPAPFEGRATLDHQGQSDLILPDDERVAVTR